MASRSTPPALVTRFLEVQAEVMAGSYELFAEVMRRAGVKVAEEIGWRLEPSRAQFLPGWRRRLAAVPRVERGDGPPRRPLPGRNRLQRRRQASRASRGVTCGPSSTSWSQLSRSAATSPIPRTSRSAARRIGGKKGWVHIASGYDRRCRAAAEDERAGDLGEPSRREARGPQGALGDRQDLPRGGEEARCRGLSRAPAQRSPRTSPTRRCSRALTSASRASAAAPHQGRGEGRAAQPGPDRRPEVRDDEPASLPQPPPAGRHVAPQGAELLRLRAQSGPRARTGTRAHFDAGARVRGETSPHYTGRPRLDGVAARMHELIPDARLDLRGPRPDRPTALALPPQRRRRLREPRSLDEVARRPAQRLRRPRPLRLPARALPERLRAGGCGNRHPGRAARRPRAGRCARSSRSSASTPLRVAGVRARVGDRARRRARAAFG